MQRRRLLWQVLGGLAVATSARADDRTSSEFFAAGQRLMAQGSYSEACVSFEHALALNAGVGTKFNLAECYEKTRRPASALSLLREVESITKQSGQNTRSRAAKDRADAIEPHVPRVTIVAPWLDKRSNVQILVDGKAVLLEHVGQSLPLDFGSHVATARLGDDETSQTVDLETDGQRATVVLSLPSGPRSLPANAVPAPSSDATGATGATGATAPTPKESSHTQRNIGWAIAGAGVATVVVGSVVALSAKARYDSATKSGACVDDVCPGDAAALTANAARNSANVAGIVDIVGLALVATGVTLWATAPASSTLASLRITPSVGKTEGTLTACGSF